MRITVYNTRAFDEKAYFEKYAKELDLELVFCEEAPNLSNVKLAEGSQCIDIITSKTDAKLIEAFSKVGVKYIATRTIGYDHIDIEAAKEYGMKVSNAPYGPNGVADYTVMMMLMSLRNMKRIIERTMIQDYSLKGLLGKEMKDMTVGVLGTGRIGSCVLKNLSGFGCKLLAYDLYQKEEVKKIAEYVPLDTILSTCDIISLHMPLLQDNFHLIDKTAINKMKKGVIIINTARGGLIDSEALIEGIEAKQIGAVALDTVEDEFGLYYNDLKEDILTNRNLAILRGFPNVTVSHHMAFYTGQYVETVVRDSLRSCKNFMLGIENPWQVS